MNKFDKGFSTLLVAITIVAIFLIGGGATYYYITKSQPETNTQVQSSTKQISEEDLLGLWTPSVDGEERMNFYIGDEGKHAYGSYSHNSPFAMGVWALDNDKLTISFLVYPKNMTFVSVTRQGNILTLKTADGKVSTHTFINE